MFPPNEFLADAPSNGNNKFSRNLSQDQPLRSQQQPVSQNKYEGSLFPPSSGLNSGNNNPLN